MTTPKGDETFVNAVIEITVPLDDVQVESGGFEKQEAVGRAMERLTDVLPDSFAECVASGHWEDSFPDWDEVSPPPDRLTPVLREADELLRRLEEWDMLHISDEGKPVTGDALFFRPEIARVRALVARLSDREPE